MVVLGEWFAQMLNHYPHYAMQLTRPFILYIFADRIKCNGMWIHAFPTVLI